MTGTKAISVNMEFVFRKQNTSFVTLAPLIQRKEEMTSGACGAGLPQVVFYRLSSWLVRTTKCS